MTYGKNGATCWLFGAVRTLQKRVEMLEAKDSFKNVECSIHEIQDTSPKVRVPRHKPAGDLEHGGVISGIRMPRPEGAAERVVQFSPVRGCQQLTDEILQCGVVEDKINMFEKIGESDSDRAALRVRCRSRSQTSEALQDPLQLRQNPNLPRFRSVEGGTTDGSATGGHTPPSAPTPSRLRQLGSPFYADEDSGGHTFPSAPTPSCLRQLGSPFYADEDLQDTENIPVMGMSPMYGGGFEQVLSDDDGLAASTVSSAIVRSKNFVGANADLCHSAGELDSEHLTACDRVETAPVRHVSFAETVEVVEFDPAVHAAPLQ